MKKNSIINFTLDNGEIAELEVIEETQLGGRTYILVSDVAEEDEEEAMGYILRQMEADDSDEVSYEMVEDDDELEAVAGLFEEMLADEYDLVPDDEA